MTQKLYLLRKEIRIYIKKYRYICKTNKQFLLGAVLQQYETKRRHTFHKRKEIRIRNEIKNWPRSGRRFLIYLQKNAH